MLKQLHLAMLICISTFILSCSNEVEDKNTSKNTSTFSLSEVKEVSTRSYSDDELWPELKNKNVTDLKVCIIDTVYKEEVDGARFELTINENTNKVVSDVHGCITWQEYIDFDYTADESYILFSGKIEGTGNFKGTQEVRIAINPWSGTVVDLNKGGSVGKVSTNNTLKKNVVNHSKINFIKALVDVKEISFEKNYSTNLSIETLIRPFLIRKNIDGTKAKDEYFTNGKFKLEFLLIQKEYGSKRKSIIAETSSVDQINEDGDLVSSINFEIKDEVKPMATIELAIRITPVDQEHRIGKKFNSLVLTSINGKKSYDLNPTSYEFRQVKELTKTKDSDNSSYVNHGFTISEVKGSYLVEDGIANGQTTNSLRERKTKLEISLADTFLHQGASGEFEVTVYDTVEDVIVDKSFRKRTDDKNISGMIQHTVNFQFDEDFEYDYREYIIQVKGLSGIYKGLSIERVVYINPRLKGSGFLVDSSDITDRSDLGTGEEINGWINFKNYKAEFQGNDNSERYKLNRNLDLLGYREMKIYATPEIKTDHNYESDNVDPKIPNSTYKVKMLIMTPKNPLLQNYDEKVDLNDFYILTGAERDDIVSDDGLITANLQFPHLFVEKNLLSFKNIAVLLIEPLDPNSKIGGGYHIGKIEMFRGGKFTIDTLYDSRRDDNKSLILKENNKLLAREMSKKIKELNHKLQDDVEILDPFLSFKKDILASNSFENVPVIDHENYNVKLEKAFINISDNEDIFLSRYSELNIDKSDLNNLFESGDFSGNTGKELCKLFYDPKQKTHVMHSTGKGVFTKLVEFGSEYRRCQKDTIGHLQIKELKFIDKITTQPGMLEKETGDPTVAARGLDLMRNEAFFSARGKQNVETQGERTTKYVGFGNHTSLDLVGKFGGPLSIFSALGPDIGVRKDYYKDTQKQQIDTDQRRVINQNGQSYHVSIFNISFRAMVNKCFLITPKYVLAHVPKAMVGQVQAWEGLLNWFTNTDSRSVVSSPVRHIICKDFPVEEELTEPYHFIRLTDLDNYEVSDRAMAKNTVGSIVRGAKAYKDFRTLDLKKDKLIMFQDKKVEDQVTKFYQDAIDKGNDPEIDIFMDTSKNSEILRRYKYFMKQMGKDIKYKDRIGIGYPGLIE